MNAYNFKVAVDDGENLTLWPTMWVDRIKGEGVKCLAAEQYKAVELVRVRKSGYMSFDPDALIREMLCDGVTRAPGRRKVYLMADRREASQCVLEGVVYYKAGMDGTLEREMKSATNAAMKRLRECEELFDNEKERYGIVRRARGTVRVVR